MTAVTLAMVAKSEERPLQKGILQNILRDAPLLETLPFSNVSSLQTVAVRWTNLPTAAFRKINANYTASHGDTEQVYESVYGFGGKITLDRVWDKVGNLIEDPRVTQLKMKSKAMALVWNDYFVNGDHGTDADGFEGLKKRISNMPSRQTVNMQGSTDILDPTASAANARKFLDKWEEAAYKANSGSFNAILVNEGLKWGLGRVLRFAGISGGPLLSIAQDQWGRRVLEYMGVPLVDAGLKRDQSTEIITVTEDPGDGGNDATSAYFVPFNMEHGIHGIQLSELDTWDEETGNQTDVLIDWWCGLAGFGSYGPVRLTNIESPAAWT